MLNKKTNKNSYLITKRIFDLTFSILFIIAFSPFLLIISILIKLSSFKDPVIYKQKRIGLNGKSFTLYKFRSMYSNANSLLENLLLSNPSSKKEWTTYHKLKKDPRIFPFGKLLRKTSLDELPQFWNIIRGDLSLIGPRPYLESQKLFLNNFESIIFSVKPGLTGLWQINGRNTVSFQKRLLLDQYYVKNASFSLDLKILFKTLYKIFYFSHAS